MGNHWIKKGLVGTVAATAMMVIGGAAHAIPTLDVQIDYDNSSVSLVSTGGGGSATISASIANSGLSPVTPLSVGETLSFDFIDFTRICTGLFCSGAETYDITATLALALPGSSVSSGGSAGALIVFGSIIGGSLSWDDVPSTLSTPSGSMYTVDFEDGIDLFLGRGTTTSASVRVDKIVEVAEPATLAIFGLGLVGLGLAARRRQTA